MNLTPQLSTLRKETDGLSRRERARICCEWAKSMEKVGEYDAAAESLEEFWPDRNAAPIVDDLDNETKATVLLRAGNLLQFLGSANQTEGSQERAKDLITQSIELFEGAGNRSEEHTSELQSR